MLLMLRVVVWYCVVVACCYDCIVLCVCAFLSCTENNAVCTLKTLQHLRSKRSRVCRQNVRVTQDTVVLTALTGAFCKTTRERLGQTVSLCLSLF